MSLIIFLQIPADFYLVVTIGAGVVKRDETAFVFGVHISAVLQQDLHDSSAIVAGGQMQGSRFPAVRSVAD